MCNQSQAAPGIAAVHSQYPSSWNCKAKSLGNWRWHMVIKEYFERVSGLMWCSKWRLIIYHGLPVDVWWICINLTCSVACSQCRCDIHLQCCQLLDWIILCACQLQCCLVLKSVKSVNQCMRHILFLLLLFFF